MLPIANSTLTIFSRNRYVAALVVLAAASILWSQEPSASLQKVFYLFVTTCFGLYLVERFTPRELMQVVMITGSIAIICSLVLAIALPRYGVFTGRAEESSGWQGIYTHKNTLGLITMYFLAPALFLPVKGTREKVGRISLYRLLTVAGRDEPFARGVDHVRIAVGFRPDRHRGEPPQT